MITFKYLYPIKTTEQESNYFNLEKKSIEIITSEINNEDNSVAISVKKCLPMVNQLIEKAFQILKNDGRLFYIGSGTSGRLGILDASECLPTFGFENKIIGIIAGGDIAIRKSQEHSEDSMTNAWKDLQCYNINQNDMVIGISASGSTPYVVGGLISCKKNGITTGCIISNKDTKIAQNSDFPIEVIVGPEYISGSSRMKAGTAQKMILNMISSTVMIKLGRVLDNKMIYMKLSNNKLNERAIRIVESILNIDKNIAKNLIYKYKNIRLAIENYKSNDK